MKNFNCQKVFAKFSISIWLLKYMYVYICIQCNHICNILFNQFFRIILHGKMIKGEYFIKISLYRGIIILRAN